MFLVSVGQKFSTGTTPQNLVVLHQAVHSYFTDEEGYSIAQKMDIWQAIMNCSFPRYKRIYCKPEYFKVPPHSEYPQIYASLRAAASCTSTRTSALLLDTATKILEHTQANISQWFVKQWRRMPLHLHLHFALDVGKSIMASSSKRLGFIYEYTTSVTSQHVQP
ncbi:uncharacterized protein LOC144377842 isoform X2 [Ictidomys tridecemlineatus]